MTKLLAVATLALGGTGCVTTGTQLMVPGYVYTDGFVGDNHTFLRRAPFTTYTVTLAEDACITYTRGALNDIVGASLCVADTFTSKESPRMTSTLSVCSVINRSEHRTQYCWVTDKAALPWKPGMITIEREPTTMTYGPALQK